MASSERIEELQLLYAERKDAMKAQLDEFKAVQEQADDRRILRAG